MKIGIITFHFTSNQGAVLQCFALKKHLEKQGHEVQVIDYCPPYHTVRYSAYKNPFMYARDRWRKLSKRSMLLRSAVTAKSFLKCIALDITQKDANTLREFESFRKKHLNLTQRYKSLKALKKKFPHFDAYISGSDQVWNPDLLDQEFDRAYFLDFGDEKTLRISYAVSMGKDMSGEEVSELKQLCSNMTAVSLREYNKEAVEATGRDVHICIDPTLLMDAEDYAEVESAETEKESYIFVYGFETNEDIKRAVETAQKKYGCRVINGSPARIRLGDSEIIAKDYGPDKFLAYIKNAQCVVTNSFHGTAFSIIYKKDFIVVPHSTRGRRMTELLTKLGLNFRLWNDESFSFDKAIDYNEAYEKLDVLRIASTSYLSEALSGKSGEEIPHHPSELPIETGNKYADWDAYYGWNKDAEQLKQSASGGGTSIIAESIIQQGGVVFGVAYASDFKSAGYVCAETVDDLSQMKGSKYIYSGMGMLNGVSVYDEIEAKLRSGKPVLVTGLGCFIGGVKRRLELHGVDTSNLYTIDLICHGPTMPDVQCDYIETLEKKFHSKVVSFSSRYKKIGWTPPYIHVEFKNGKVYNRRLYESDFGYAFQTYSRGSCYNCHFKGNNHAADITVGDFWGTKPGMPEYNENGVSVFLCRTDKGRKLIKMIDKEKFHIGKTKMERVILYNPMFERSWPKPAYHDEFVKCFKVKGLHYAVVHSSGYRLYVKKALKKRLKAMLER